MALFCHEKYLIVCGKEWQSVLVRDISHAIRQVCLLRSVHLQWNDRTASAMISAMLRRIAATSSTSRRRSDGGLFLQLHNKHAIHIKHQTVSWTLPSYWLSYIFTFRNLACFPLQVQNTGKRNIMCWVCLKEAAFKVGHIVRKRSWPVRCTILTLLEGRKKDHGQLRISEIPSDTPKGNLPNTSKSLPPRQRARCVLNIF